MKHFLKKFLRSNWGQAILSFVGYNYIKFVYHTSSWGYINKSIIETYLKEDRPFIICFWHGRLMMLPLAWQWPQPFKMLLSAHGDGTLIAKVLKHFRLDYIEGSTTRGGTKACLQIIQSSKEGVVVGITPDGPRGPLHTVSPGTVALAKWVQADLIPVSYGTRGRRILKTWDQFYFPLPFTKGAFVIGNPVPYPLDDKDFNKVSEILKQHLDLATSQADSYVQPKT